MSTTPCAGGARLRPLLATAGMALVVGVAAIARVDRALVQMGREAVRTLLERERGALRIDPRGASALADREVDTPRVAAVEPSGEPRSEPPPAPPPRAPEVEASNGRTTQARSKPAPVAPARPWPHLGRTREELLVELGYVLLADSLASYHVDAGGIVHRVVYVAGRSSQGLELGDVSSHDFEIRALADLGTDAAAIRATWGPPDHVEGEEWFYAGSEGSAGVRLLFERGKLVKHRRLPSFWRRGGAGERGATRDVAAVAVGR